MRQEITKAIDISKHNGNVNMKAVKNFGIDHVIIRAGYGNNNIDQKFNDNALAAKNLGMNTGFYWFSYALDVDMATSEAIFAVNAVSKYFSKCMIAYDAEYDTRTRAAKAGVNLTKNELTAMAYYFLRKVAEAGYTPCLYTNNDFTKNFFDVPHLKEKIPNLYIWYARYGKEDKNVLDLADMWQYTSSGAVPGIFGAVDMNKVFVEYNGDSACIPQKENPFVKKNPNLYIKKFQEACLKDNIMSPQTDGTFKLITADGIDGPDTERIKNSLIVNKFTYNIVPNIVKFIQECLFDRGFYRGAIDGIYGDKTFAAVRQFQEKNNLEVDGIVGKETINGLFYG